MELCDIYYGFWEGMKEISKKWGVPKWIYMVGNLREKRKVDCSKRPSEKKNDLQQKQKKRKKEKI